jgi:DNA-directed RNA polymerase I subunit RPA1
VTSQFPPNQYFAAVSESAEEILDKFLKSGNYNSETVRDLMYVKSAKSLADPGEPVGLIAAQSIGEPSTQMTVSFECDNELEGFQRFFFYSSTLSISLVVVT